MVSYYTSRVKYVKKKNLTATQKAQAELLYNAGHYGTGIYEMNDPDVGRKDISWSQVNDEDLVIVQTPDTNRLAMGGIPILDITSNTVKTKPGFFTTASTGTGANAKPQLSAGDIIQIAGVRGMEEVNGRVFEVISVSGTDALTIKIGTSDGTSWAGPGSTALITTGFSSYINGGVVIVDPHPVLQYKSDIRERQINIGSPNPETGLNAKFWNQPTGDFNAQYPYNHVYESESGHIKEYDDTPGGERIHEFHRAGTFYEIDHAGNKVDYVKGDRYDISLNDDYVYVKGRVVHTYDNEVLIRCNDRLDLSSKWKMQIWSGGDLDIHSKRNINLKSDGDINLQADGHINLQGTTLTPDQAKYQAGTKGVGEMSKIKMKAAHLQAEMIGNIDKKEIAGIALQSNLAPIQIKTVNAGASIFVTSAEDVEMYANTNFYRSAYTGFIDDYAKGKYQLQTYTGTIFITSSSASIEFKASGDIVNTGSEIHLNSTAASAATPLIANIAETFTMLVTDLSNPDPGDPPLISTDSHGLALNANDLTYGSGGENIRDLQDLLSDMSSGIVAHTGTYPTDTGAHTATGTRTTTTAGEWSGYVDGPLASSYTLGPKSLSDSRKTPS